MDLMVVHLRWRVLVALYSSEGISCSIKDKLWRIVAYATLVGVSTYLMQISELTIDLPKNP